MPDNVVDDRPLYITCPRCRGGGFVYAYTTLPTEFTPGVSEAFSCPVCSGMGDADRDRADEWAAANAEDEDG